MQPRLSRRGVLAGAATLALTTSYARADGFDWKRYKGDRVEVFLQKSARADMLAAWQGEFEQLTGIKVGFEQVPEQQHRQKFVVEFASGRPSFDVAGIAPHVQKRLLGKTKWLLDLRPLLADPAQTAPDFDLPDFSPSAIDFATHPDGRMDMLIQNIDYNILYWNKALFDAKGIKYPASFDELTEAAKRLHDPAHGVAGFVARGLKNANSSVWSAFLLGWGRYGIDPDLTVHTTSPESVAAATLYQTLMRNYAPMGVTGFNWNESQTTFSQGRGAMWLDASGFAQPLEDPKKSRVAGKVGYGVIPPGPVANVSGLTGDALGIPAASQRKGPAWLYVQWACSKDIMTRQLASGAGAPPRQSAFAAVRASADLSISREWLDCMEASSRIARPLHPQIVAVTEYRDIFGVALTNMIGGADPAAQLEAATKQFMPILQRTEA